MTWRDVARGDLLHLRRSNMGWAVTTFVLLSTVGVVVGGIGLQALSPYTVVELQDALLLVAGIQAAVLPLVALVASYGAIVTERRTGSIRFLLGWPNSRFDAYLGKLVSRTLLVAGPLVVGLLVAWPLGVAGLAGEGFGVSRAAVGLLTVLFWSVVYTVVFVGVGLTLSASVGTTTRAVAGICGSLLLFRGLWPASQWLLLQTRPVEYATGQPYPEWYYVVGRLNPMNAFVKLTAPVLKPEIYHPLLTVPEGPAVGYTATTAGFAAVGLLLWVVVAPWLGYAVFRSADLP